MSTEIQRIFNSVQALSLKDQRELAVALERAELIPPVRPNRDLILSIQGKYACVPTSSGEFMARKQEDLALEHRGDDIRP
jgi:hypothetical protein